MAMARQERSAGVILVRPASSSTGHLFLLLDYGKHWDYPKGHVEAGEDDESAALRELQEETGISDVDLVPGFAREITYFFRDKRKRLVRKSVIYFLAQTTETKVHLSEEHVGFGWLSYEESLQRLTFATSKQLLREAHQHLVGLQQSLPAE